MICIFFKTRIKSTEEQKKNTASYFTFSRKSNRLSLKRLAEIKTYNKSSKLDIPEFMKTKGSRRTHLRKPVAAAAALAAVGIAASVFSANFTVAYNVVASDSLMGVVATKEEAETALDNAKQNLAELNGAENSELDNAKIGFTIALKDTVQSEANVKENIVETFDERQDFFGVFADGELIGVTETEQTALEAIESYKAMYSEGLVNPIEISLANSVTVEPVKANASELITAGELVEKFSSPSENIISYSIKPGDTLSKIAVMFSTTSDKLIELNPSLNPLALRIGGEIKINDPSPLVKVHTAEQITEEEVIAFATETIEDPSSYKGTSAVLNEGTNGKREVTYEVIKENGVETARNQIAENILVQPVSKRISVGTMEKPRTAPTGTYVVPYRGTVTSNFGARWGRNHNGVDLAGPTGSPVAAADGGTVVKAGYYNSFGNLIVIDHGSKTETYYAHLSAINVSVGQKVAQGDIIGKVGSTGNSTGPHLHFEIRKSGNPVNPRPYINY